MTDLQTPIRLAGKWAARRARGLLFVLPIVVLDLASVPQEAVAAPPKAIATARNLYIVATEELANRIVAHTETTTEPVVDFILGARVRGESAATADVTMDFKPGSENAVLCFCLHTEIASDTVGTTRVTLTRTYGRHSLLASKPVFFDGLVLSTRRPNAAVVPRNFTRGVSTPASGVPLVGPAVDRFVYSEVQKRRSEGERIAAGRILDQAVPKFNSGIDEQLAKLNIALRETVRPKLSQWHLLPDAQDARSSETRMRYGALLWSEREPQFDQPPAAYYENGSLVVAVHESFLNAAIERQGLGGVSLPDRQLDKWITKFAETLQKTKPPVAAPSGPALPSDDTKPLLATVRLDADDPIRFLIADGRLVLTLRLGIIPVVGAEIPTQAIAIPLGLSVREGEVVVSPGKVKVGGSDETDSKVPALVRTLIGQQVESRLKALKIDGHLSIPAGDDKTVALSVTEIAAENGWLVVKFN